MHIYFLDRLWISVFACLSVSVFLVWSIQVAMLFSVILCLSLCKLLFSLSLCLFVCRSIFFFLSVCLYWVALDLIHCLTVSLAASTILMLFYVFLNDQVCLSVSVRVSVCLFACLLASVLFSSTGPTRGPSMAWQHTITGVAINLTQQTDSLKNDHMVAKEKRPTFVFDTGTYILYGQ